MGQTRPASIITNAGARPGDFLVLTKPLGLGIITTAAKRNEDDLDAISEAITVMTTLNRDASLIMVEAGAHTRLPMSPALDCWDICEVWQRPAESAQVWADLVPCLPAAGVYVQRGIAPGGSHANLRFLSNWVDYDVDITNHERLLLCDAQTSGGLLAALPGDRAAQVVRKLRVAAASTAPYRINRSGFSWTGSRTSLASLRSHFQRVNSAADHLDAPRSHRLRWQRISCHTRFTTIEIQYLREKGSRQHSGRRHSE